MGEARAPCFASRVELATSRSPIASCAPRWAAGTAYYDGTVSPAFIHFERRFAESGVAGIISATIGVNKERMSPLEYPSLYDDRFVAPLKDAVRQITAGTDCRYIVQLGDTGAHTHTSLKPQDEDRISASPFFDLLYGYHNRSREMSGRRDHDRPSQASRPPPGASPTPTATA